MAQVTFIKDGQTIVVQASDDGAQSLLEIAHANNINMDHACGGNGVCTTCMCKIQEGAENLNELTDAEDMMGVDDGTGSVRLGCQAFVKGDVVVEPAF